MRILRPALVDHRGFTLAELLVAIAIVGLIMAGILTLLMSGNESYLTRSNQVEAQAALRVALERMIPDIREAGFDPMGRGACTPPAPTNCFDAVINAGPTGFTIQSDWNGSGTIEPGSVVQLSYTFGSVSTNVARGERITYSVAGGTLTRQESAVDAQPQVLVTSVQPALQPFFQYLDANGTVLPGGPVASPWLIRTTLGVGVQNQPPAIWQAGAVQVTMSARIRLKNR